MPGLTGFRNPRATLWETPSTVSEFDCHGNEVGMPALRWCVCALPAGMVLWARGTPVGTVVEFQATVALFQLGARVPVWVSARPPMAPVWPGAKSPVYIDLAVTRESQSAGTPFGAPSVNSTMIRRPDCEPTGTDFSSSHAR